MLKLKIQYQGDLHRYLVDSSTLTYMRMRMLLKKMYPQLPENFQVVVRHRSQEVYVNDEAQFSELMEHHQNTGGNRPFRISVAVPSPSASPSSQSMPLSTPQSSSATQNGTSTSSSAMTSTSSLSESGNSVYNPSARLGSDVSSVKLSTGAIRRIHCSLDESLKPLLQVIELQRCKGPTDSTQDRYRIKVSDGDHFKEAMVCTQLHPLITNGSLKKHCCVRVNQYMANMYSGKLLLIVQDLEVVTPPLPHRIGDPCKVTEPLATPSPPPSSQATASSSTDAPEAPHNANLLTGMLKIVEERSLALANKERTSATGQDDQPASSVSQVGDAGPILVHSSTSPLLTGMTDAATSPHAPADPRHGRRDDDLTDAQTNSEQTDAVGDNTDGLEQSSWPDGLDCSFVDVSTLSVSHLGPAPDADAGAGGVAAVNARDHEEGTLAQNTETTDVTCPSPIPTASEEREDQLKGKAPATDANDRSSDDVHVPNTQQSSQAAGPSTPTPASPSALSDNLELGNELSLNKTSPKFNVVKEIKMSFSSVGKAMLADAPLETSTYLTSSSLGPHTSLDDNTVAKTASASGSSTNTPQEDDEPQSPRVGGSGPAVASATPSSAFASSIHEGYVCSMCQVDPIVGDRYNCMVCDNINLCSRCESSHDPTHDLVKRKVSLAASATLNATHVRSNANGGAASGSSPLSSSSSTLVRRREAEERKYHCTFVSDETIEDGVGVQPGTQFTKIWKVRNTGSEAWDGSCALSFVGGDVLGATQDNFPVPPCEPGEECDIMVDMEAPGKPGRHKGMWRMKRDGEEFGSTMWVEIVVQEQHLVDSFVFVPNDGASPFFSPAFGAPAQSGNGVTPTPVAGDSRVTPRQLFPPPSPPSPVRQQPAVTFNMEPIAIPLVAAEDVRAPPSPSPVENSLPPPPSYESSLDGGVPTAVPPPAPVLGEERQVAEHATGDNEDPSAPPHHMELYDENEERTRSIIAKLVQMGFEETPRLTTLARSHICAQDAVDALLSQDRLNKLLGRT